MAKKKEEFEDAIDAVDKAEDEAADKKPEDESEDVIVCPKCKRPVTETDYNDQFANPMEDSAITKILCPNCGYSGIPIEMGMKQYQAWLKEGK